MSKARQAPAGAVHLIVWSDSGSDQIAIHGARMDYIRATKIVNKLNDWEVERSVREWNMVLGNPPRERKYYHQPYTVESVDVR